LLECTTMIESKTLLAVLQRSLLYLLLTAWTGKSKAFQADWNFVVWS
jgi:hypothetical protein